MDLSDQMGSYSNPLHRSVKWYRKVAFELLLTASVVNVFTLCKQITQSNMDITAFKKEVIRCLANDAEEGTNFKSEQNGPQHKKQRIHCFKKIERK